MDIKKILSFHAFMESGCNYKETAKKSSVTIPGLRKQLTSLETELGIKLFDVRGKTTYPTRYAKILQEKTYRILNDYTDIVHYFDNDFDSIEKPLIIRTTNAVASLWISDYLKTFIQQNPESNITVHGSDIKPDLIKDNVDIYIGGKLPDPQDILNQHAFQTYNMRLYASEAYLKKYGTPQKVEDLRKHRIIGFGSESIKPYQDIDWHLYLLDPPLKTNFNINSGGGLLRAVELGYGIGVISNLGADVAKTKLVNILPEIQGLDIPVYFSYPKFLEGDIRIVKLLETLLESPKPKKSESVKFIGYPELNKK